MPDDLEYEIRRLRDWRHQMDKTVNALDWRLDELEKWRKRDEPRIELQDRDKALAAELRQALAERSRHEWARWQKALAVVVTIVTLAGGVTSFLNAIGVL